VKDGLKALDTTEGEIEGSPILIDSPGNKGKGLLGNWEQLEEISGFGVRGGKEESLNTFNVCFGMRLRVLKK